MKMEIYCAVDLATLNLIPSAFLSADALFLFYHFYDGYPMQFLLPIIGHPLGMSSPSEFIKYFKNWCIFTVLLKFIIVYQSNK
jgi:hypothetical protein